MRTEFGHCSRGDRGGGRGREHLEKSREVSEALGVGSGGGDSLLSPFGAMEPTSSGRDRSSRRRIPRKRSRSWGPWPIPKTCSQLSEDTEKLQTDLQIAFRKITSLEKSKQEAERSRGTGSFRNSLLRS